MQMPMIMPFPTPSYGGGYRRKKVVYKKKKLSKTDAKILRSAKRFQKQFPWKDYGQVARKRGTEQNLDNYGASWAEAFPQQREARKTDGFRGRGSYWGSELGNWAGNAIGGAIGSLAGPSGATFGAGLGGRVGSYLGDVGSSAADRFLANNQLINPGGPSMSLGVVSSENEILVGKREYIGDLVGDGSAFQVPYLLQLQPGISATFPYLSQLAQYFDEYEFYELIFEVVSMVTEGNNTAAGTIVMSTQYNANNGAFTNKQTQEQYDYANSFKVTASGAHGVETDPSKNAGPASLYIRTAPAQANQDIKTFDIGVTQVSLCNVPNGLVTGELWVRYKCKLKKHKLLAPGQSPSPNVLEVFANDGGSGVCTLLNQFSFVTPKLFNAAVTIQSDPSGGALITFPSYICSGKFVVQYQMSSPGGVEWLEQIQTQLPRQTNNCSVDDGSGVLPKQVGGGTSIKSNAQIVQFTLTVDAPAPNQAASFVWVPVYTLTGDAPWSAGLVIVQVANLGK